MAVSRDTRLLPRLIESLDTLDDVGDIANTVRRIRQILGTQAFSSRMGALASPESKPTPNRPIETLLSADHVWRLRGLALRLRLKTHAEPDIAQAKERICAWLAGTSDATGHDLMLMLLFLGDLAESERKRARTDPPAWTTPIQQGVLDAMAEIVRGMGGRTHS
jgi:hypothetical protein